MSHGVVPRQLRHSFRVNSSRVATRCTLAALIASVLLVSLLLNTHRAQQHVIVSIKHFQEADAAVGQPGNSRGSGWLVEHAGADVKVPPVLPQGAASPGSVRAASGAANSTDLSHTHSKQSHQDTRHTGNTGSSSLGVRHQLHALESHIPQIIHQNYLSGRHQLLSDALKPRSHFRKEWWQSCKTHHPGWRHMFWDEARCERLLRQHYPWFLDTWAALGDSTVLKSDAIRPFILHAYGGVYLDLDSECFTDMSPWLQGAQFVMQAEVGHTINNAQMASVPRHPVWPLFQKSIQARVAAGKRWPLDTTGPHLLTDIVRQLTNNTHSDLPGACTLADGSKVAVYGPGQWFTPCAWNDWTCAVQVARDRPLLTAAGAAAVAAATAKAFEAKATSTSAAAPHLNASTAAAAAVTRELGSGATVGAAAAAAAASAGRTFSPKRHTAVAAAAAGFPLMLGAAGVCGVHHFSGSWLGLDGSKSLSLRREGVSGVLTFLYNGSGFVQRPCRELSWVPQSPPQPTLLGRAGLPKAKPPSVSLLSVPVCWEDVSAAVASGNCSVLSVRTLPAQGLCSSTGNCHAAQSNATHRQQQQLRVQEWLGPELAFAAMGCQVKLVTDMVVDLAAPVTPQNSVQGQHLRADTTPAHSLLNSNNTSGSSSSSSNVGGSSGSSSDIGGGSGSERRRSGLDVLPRLHQVTSRVGLAADPFAEPPVHTLETLLETEMQGKRVTLLLLDLPGPQTSPPAAVQGLPRPAAAGCVGELDLLNHLYLGSSAALQRVDAAVLMLPLPGVDDSHKAFAAYQHVFQENGFSGYFHSKSAAQATRAVAAGVFQTAGAAASGSDLQVQLGLTRRAPLRGPL